MYPIRKHLVKTYKSPKINTIQIGPFGGSKLSSIISRQCWQKFKKSKY